MSIIDERIGILFPRYLKYSDNRDDAIKKLSKDLWWSNKDFLKYVTDTVNLKFYNPQSLCKQHL